MTAKIEHILVPTDGSEHALKAAAFAGDLARAMKARVSLLVVHEDDVIVASAWGAGINPAGSPRDTMSVDEVRTQLERQSRDKELPATVTALGELQADPALEIAWGNTADEICRFASEQQVNLIVVGSHGRTGIRRAFLGSVSQAVANQAPCPVTIVR